MKKLYDVYQTGMTHIII